VTVLALAVGGCEDPCPDDKIIVLSNGTFVEDPENAKLIDAVAEMTKETLTLEYTDQDGRRFRVTYDIIDPEK